MRLSGFRCVVTGAARGIGQAIAIRFAQEGASVALFDRNDCHETEALIRTQLPEQHTQKFCQVVLDLSSGDETLFAQATKEAAISLVPDAEANATAAISEPCLHVLVNNAAYFVFASVESATSDDWDRSLNVNIRGSALLTKHALPFLKLGAAGSTPNRANGNASIIFLGSISSFRAQPNCATYSATKASVVQLAKNCALDFSKYGVRVNSVCPGTIETPISADEQRAQGLTREQWEKTKVKDTMLRRVGSPEEVANAVLFFASSESSYCTGTSLMVDGGQAACTVMPDVEQ